MKKALVIAGIGLTLVFSGPGVAAALSTQELQVQIQALLEKVEELQRQLAALQNQGTSPGGGGVAEAPASCRVWNDGCNTCSRSSPDAPFACTLRYCVWQGTPSCEESFPSTTPGNHAICSVSMVHSLSQGSVGQIVRALQEFLRDQGFYSGEATGYFGIQTQQSLQAWQAHVGLVLSGTPFTTGWGVLGPRTWQRIREYCGIPVTETPYINVYPSTGSAPLTVQVTAKLRIANPNIVADYGDLKIVFGDGTEEKLTCTHSSGFCTNTHAVPHTYKNPGTYTVQLVHYNFYGPAEESIAGRVVSTATVTVTDTTGGVCTKEYVPVCGRPAGCANTCPSGMYCAMLCQLHEPQTYVNRCVLDAAQAEYLSSGACPTTTVSVPSISRFSGPTTLGVGRAGTWEVSATDSHGGNLTYNIVWGDEYVGSTVSASAPQESKFTQNTSFTHTYAQAGTYTITVTVTSASGNSAQATATVLVTGSNATVCTMEYAPVCAQPSICQIAKYAPGAYPEYCRSGQTYSNRCMMTAENASFIHQGTCANGL